MNNLSNLMVPIELVTVAVLGLVAALGWLSRRYDKAMQRSRADQRETAIMMRELLRERNPRLDPLSFDEDSALFDVEHKKDIASVRNLSERPSRLSPRQERRLERFTRDGDPGDPSTPPDPVEPVRKKFPSRGGE